MPLPLLTLLLALTLTPQSTALQLHLHLHLPTPLPANFFIHLNAIPHPLPLPPLPNGEYTLQPFSETQRFPKYRFAILPSYNTKGEGEGEEKEEKEGEEEEGGIYNLHEETPGIQYIATTPIKSEPVIIIKAYETGECYKVPHYHHHQSHIRTDQSYTGNGNFMVANVYQLTLKPDDADARTRSADDDRIPISHEKYG